MHPKFALFLGMAGLALAGCSRSVDIADRDTDGLIAAIRAANAGEGPTVIRLAPRGLYTLRTAPRDADTFLPPITGELRIEGRGAEIRRYADGERALLRIERGADVRLQSLALSEGSDGAIRNFGTLRLDQVRITDSTAGRTPAIVLNYGLLDARDSEIAWNMLPAARRDAGTVLNYGRLVLRDTRIHDNLAQRGYDSLAVAGAVLNLGTLDARGSGIADNQALDGDHDDTLAFPAVLDLGTGHVEGDLPAALVREAGMVEVAQR
jgi:predicted secreted protein